jgi:hypothetical protein
MLPGSENNGILLNVNVWNGSHCCAVGHLQQGSAYQMRQCGAE